jgi:hypothetical protein
MRAHLFAASAACVLSIVARDAIAQAPQTPSDAPAVAGVMVRIDSPEPVDLEAQVDGKWTVVCSAPCGKPLSPTLLYRVSGKDVRASREFRLEPGKTITLDIEPGTKPNRVGGVIMVVVGLAGLVPGAVVTTLEMAGLFMGALFICPFVAAFASKDKQSGAYGDCLGDIASEIGKYYAREYVWIPAIVGGALAGMGGIWLALSTGTPTQVTQKAARATPRGDAAAWRRPEWNTPQIPNAPVLGNVPIIDFSF